MAAFDIHDRVNYAVTESKLKIEKDRSMIALNLQIDESIKVSAPCMIILRFFLAV
ncbi:hypothetical protein [Fusicatenibacter faecihominis]|uniref:hypothetical protein n=1 Tax=Fusicatenibacter faecihominis TaxID=2881276 RepID=UPI002F417CA4